MAGWGIGAFVVLQCIALRVNAIRPHPQQELVVLAHNARFFLGAGHCVRFARTSLAIAEDTDVETVQGTLDNRPVTVFIELCILHVRAEDTVEIIPFMHLFTARIGVIEGDLLASLVNLQRSRA